MYDPSYPRVPSSPINGKEWDEVNPRPLLPILPPPSSLGPLPNLPSPPRTSPFDGWQLTTHIVPAASPRTVPLIPIPIVPSDSVPKEERKKVLREAGEELLRLKGAQSAGQEHQDADYVSRLWIVVNRFRKTGAQGGRERLTVLFAHANGFHKEIWEETINNFLRTPSSSMVDEMWCWEASNHGDSALLNVGKLGGLFDWLDNARDIINFLAYYMPASPSADVLPTYLQAVSSEETVYRLSKGWKERTLVTVGHSFGGATAARAAIDVPSLFSALILADPVIYSPRTSGLAMLNYVLGAVSRRNSWPTREAAFEAFMQVPFFMKWDVSVLRAYVEHALIYDGKNNSVRLKQGGMLEAINFAEVRTPQEVGTLLPFLDERVELLWVMPGVGATNLAGDNAAKVMERVWRRQGTTTSNVRIKGAGHLIPQEKPDAMAQAIHHFLEKKFGNTRANL